MEAGAGRPADSTAAGKTLRSRSGVQGHLGIGSAFLTPQKSDGGLNAKAGGSFHSLPATGRFGGRAGLGQGAAGEVVAPPGVGGRQARWPRSSLFHRLSRSEE